jgi:hypothetical protein
VPKLSSEVQSSIIGNEQLDKANRIFAIQTKTKNSGRIIAKLFVIYILSSKFVFFNVRHFSLCLIFVKQELTQVDPTKGWLLSYNQAL